MRQTRLLIVFFISFFVGSLPCFGYTVVLKSTGKQVKGDLVSEDENQLHLRDQSGITLVFKKATLDLKQMEVLNKPLPKEPATATSQTQPAATAKKKPSLSDAKVKKTGKGKVLKIEDLDKTPELSVIGSAESNEQEPSDENAESVETEESTTEKTDETPSAQEEQYWRDRIKQMRLQIEDLKKKAAEAQITCESTGGRSSSERAGSTYLPNTNCKNADDFAAQAEAIEEQIRVLRSEAIVKNLPLEWFQ